MACYRSPGFRAIGPARKKHEAYSDSCGPIDELDARPPHVRAGRQSHPNYKSITASMSAAIGRWGVAIETTKKIVSETSSAKAPPWKP